MQDGLRRMVADQEDVYYYLTVMNENYAHAGPARLAWNAHIIKGMYPFRKGVQHEQARRACSCWAAGTIFREVIAAAELLEEGLGRRAADLWSCPSFTELARDGQDAERWNLLHPTDDAARVVRGAAAQAARRAR